MFQTTKIQIFESNSQQALITSVILDGCFRLQRYKFLKAIHNYVDSFIDSVLVVSDYKDTNFWKQFTTVGSGIIGGGTLFQTTKIQIFESNSQQRGLAVHQWGRCFRLQRYKFLKAIHNAIYWRRCS